MPKKPKGEHHKDAAPSAASSVSPAQTPEERLASLEAEFASLDRENAGLIDELMAAYTELIRALDKKDPLKGQVIAKMRELRTLRGELKEQEKAEAVPISFEFDPKIDDYLRAVEEGLGLEAGTLETPPAHITLFTGENGKGIGINNEAQLEERTTVLEGADLEAIESHLATE